ncbi:MAG: ribosomal protein S18-alanine N-acetyltransferase [Sporichthyaceae bacterium]
MDAAHAVRAARWGDIPALAEIEADLFGSDAWSVETFWSELAGVPASRWYRVATQSAEDEAIVGYVGLAWSGESADVQTIAVDSRAQGRGLGGLLLDALIEQARARGCTEILLEVRVDNTSACALYVGRGFEQIARRRRYYRDGVDALILRKNLTADQVGLRVADPDATAKDAIRSAGAPGCET